MNPVVVLLGEVTLVFGVALLGVLLASRARAALRHLILACAFGVVLILPLATLVSPTITVEIGALPAREPEMVVADPVAVNAVVPPAVPMDAPVAVEAVPLATTPLPSVAAGSIPVATWLLLAWAVVALIALAPVVAGLWHLRRIRSSSHLWSEGAERVAQLMHPAASPRLAVLLHVKIAAPITGGLIHPAIALPVDAMTWSNTHLTNALLHELEHVRRRDWAVHLAARVACALYWFHPLAWMTWRVLRLEAERACDDAVLAREDAAVYAEQLLELARHLSGKPALPGMHMAGNSSLSSRIRAVLDNTRQRGRASKVMVAVIAVAAVVAIALLAPLRPTGPTRATTPAADPVIAADPAGAGAESAASQSPPAEPPAPAFDFGKRVAVADLRDGGCLVVFDLSVAPGTKVTLVKPRSSDPPAVMQATAGEVRPDECRPSQGRKDSDIGDPTYYRIAITGSDKPPYGSVFAIVDPVNPVSLRNGDIVADIDGDDAPETFATCNSTENVHFMVWTGAGTSKRQRWHGAVYVGYDMEPDCTDEDVAGMESLQKPESRPAPKPSGKTATSPQPVVSGILDLVQSALADDTTGRLDEITRPITGLHHVQSHARAVLADDGSNLAALAANYLAIINGLINTADLAATITARQPQLDLPPEKFRQLAAAMRTRSAELAAAIMPTSEVRQINLTLTDRAALSALELAQTTRSDRRFSRSWLDTELGTLERAAQSVASDDGSNAGATTLKLNLLRRSLQTTTSQANDIMGRANLPADSRRKAADLASSLRDITGRLDGNISAPRPDNDSRGWLLTVRSVGPLPIGATIGDVRSLISDPAAYLTKALYEDAAMPREPDTSSCAYLVSTRLPGQLGLMFQKGRLARIDVGAMGIRTTTGAQIGDSESRILDLYGSRVSVTQHHYPPAGAHYMTFKPADDADRDYRMLFETDGSRVTRFRTGLRAAVDQVEGCD